MTDSFMWQPKKHAWFRNRLARYSLRSFLVLFTLVALWFGWLAVVGNHQRRVLRIVDECGGAVVYKYQEDGKLYLDTEAPFRVWLASIVGDEYVFSIAGVYLDGMNVDDDVVRRITPLLEKLRYLVFVEFRDTNITDDSMEHIGRLGQLERLFVRSSLGDGAVPVQVTDAGLEPISKLKNLKLLSVNNGTISGTGFQYLSTQSTVESLDFRDTNVADESLKHLRGLSHLREIVLRRTDITNAGLVHLSTLPNLEHLYLSETEVSDEGIKLLADKKTLRILDVADTGVTDAGLVAISKLDLLQELRLSRTEVSDAGLSHLVMLKNLRILQLGNTKITDSGLAQLQSMKQLKELAVSCEGVTNAAVLRLRKALPQCNVE